MESVVRLRSTATADRYGGTVKDWTAPDSLTIEGCLVAPRTEGETTDGGREGVVIGWTVYAPHGADILATDRVEVRGVAHEVDGEPSDWSGGFTTWTPGVEIQLRRVEG